MSSPISVDSKGYGKIYKAVMRNPALPLLAKTIYAYFCAYAGCGCTAFPKREKFSGICRLTRTPTPSTCLGWWRKGT